MNVAADGRTTNALRHGRLATFPIARAPVVEVDGLSRGPCRQDEWLLTPTSREGERT